MPSAGNEKPGGTALRLVVGLGNPGRQYIATRHNIGFVAVDRLSKTNNIYLHKKEFSSVSGSGSICGHRVLVAKPMTYMNLCGEAVGDIVEHYTIAPEDIIVVHDDMDISPGQLKIKLQGGSAGHRGVESIIRHVGLNTFTRIRVGIGKPPPHINPADFVLQAFSQEEYQLVKGVIANICNCIELILTQGPREAMNRFHRAHPTNR